MKTIIKLLVSISLVLMMIVGGCKKDEILTTPVVVTPPTAITPDPGPVEGDYRIIITDPNSEIGMITRLPKFNIDIIAAGKRDTDGFITDITSVLISNPNSKAWLGAEIDKGYPVKLVSSTGYVAELKDYNRANKTVMATILLDGKVIQTATVKKLSDSFFENIDQYSKVKNGRIAADFATECEKTKKAMSALGTVANAMGCVGGFVYPPAGLIGGLGWLNSCYGAIDGAFELASGKSLTERVWGKENGQTVKDVLFASNFLNATANPKAVGELLNKALGWYGKAADGSGYVPCNPSPNAHSTGDPRLTTPDGLNYSFQGHGEFIATKSTTDNFEVQVRQEDVNKNGKATLNTAVAVQTASDAVCVTVKPDRLFINNQAQNLTTFTTLALKDGASVTKAKINNYDVIDVKVKNGDIVRVRFHGSYLLDYSLFLQDNRKTKLIGILGDFDGDKNNDVTIRNGENIMKDGTLPFGKLYPTFADSWRITQANSLFYYDAGKNTDSYTDKNFPRTPETITADQRTKAEGICRAAGVTTEPFLSNCILDVAITDDPTLASSSLWGQSINTLPPSLPVPIIQEAVDIKRIATHNQGSFVLKADGTLWVTGWSNHGQFGIGKNYYEFDTKNYFVKIMDGIKDIATGDGNHMLFLKNDNSVWAAGYNSAGQIGNGVVNGDNVLTAIKIMDNGKTLATGSYQSFVIKTDNTLWAFGANSNGQLGDGTKVDRGIPVKIMDDVKAVAAGYYQTLILKTDNTLWGMGSALYGALGVPQASPYERPTPFKIMDDALTMAVGNEHSLVIKNDKTLWVSGDNLFGQLGIGSDGSSTDLFKFTKVADNVQAVAAGDYHSFLLKTDNTLWATGRNNDGQFGNGTKTNRNTFGQVATGVKSVVTNGGTGGSEGITFIIKTDNTLWASGGSNSVGLLGDGTSVARLTFVPINVK